MKARSKPYRPAGTEEPVGYKPKILVVEPDSAARRQYESTLRALGAEPLCFGDSRKAAQHVNKEKFDGAFLSWESPGLSGEDLTMMIRRSKSNATIPVVMLTAAPDGKLMAAGFRAGVTFFLSKPVGAKELRRLLSASHGSMVEERLRYQRVPLPVAVKCVWKNARAMADGIDISGRGLLLRLDPQPPQGAEMALEFTLPGSRTRLRLTGVVARLGKKGEVGVKFDPVGETERGELKAYVDRAVGAQAERVARAR